MHFELEKNLPSHPNWSDSFYGKLAEEGEWDVEAFWRLHLDLLNIAKGVQNEKFIARDLVCALVYIQNGVLDAIAYNSSKRDIFNIRNIDENSIMQFKERFSNAMISICTGDIPPEASFDLVNPLL